MNAVIPPYEPSWSRAVYHLYVIRTRRPRRHDEPFEKGRYRHRNSLSGSVTHAESLCLAELRLEDFPVAREVAAEIVSLPMFPQLTAEQQARVAEELLACTSKAPKRAKGGDSDA